MNFKLSWIPALLALLLAAVLGLKAPSPKGFDLAGAGALPVLQNGRIKPLDTVARASLLVMRGKQSVRDGQRTLEPTEWLLDVLANPEVADKYPVFMINDADVLAMLGKRPDEARFHSFADLTPKLDEIRTQAEQASKIEPQRRDRFQRAVTGLEEKLTTYQRLKNTMQLEDTRDLPMEMAAFAAAIPSGAEAFRLRQAGQTHDQAALDQLGSFLQRYQFLDQAASFRPLLPPKGGTDKDWTTMGAGLLASLRDGQLNPQAAHYAMLLRAWKQGDAGAFATSLASLQGDAQARIPSSASKTRIEVLFNRMEPFYLGIWFYFLAALMIFVSWLAYEKPLQEAAWYLMLATLGIHTFGMFTRMWLEGRPPVTNLYSSAVFIGWIAVLLCIPFERWSRRGFAALGGAIIGAATLIIAQGLTGQGSGDTLEMMQAVLDSNFWLATHVTTITIGYSATFLAGLLAHIWIFRSALSKNFSKEDSTALNKATYGVICFALFFSFVGTVLGGIWADQSWGRFWGWDPKENGALLIVLWNALILHARWAGYARERGLMVMAVFGGIITSLSWFGVNMLGIGLHSYGFMDKTLYALLSFISFEVLVIAFALIWPKISDRPTPKAA
ncbi:MAG: cytochrome c biogenesis protein CcsA [Holophagaceae bacterium]|nr:cytochrome c biogenesis protein CcsA [Holophagaceae bacterium]